MCLWTTKKRCNNFLKKNQGKTWIYVWKALDTHLDNKSLISPYQRKLIKCGVNRACCHYTVNFSHSLMAVINGSHVFLEEKDAKKFAQQKYLIVVRCKVYLKDFIAAGVWRLEEKKKSSYQAVFSKIHITKYQYNKALK